MLLCVLACRNIKLVRVLQDKSQFKVRLGLQLDLSAHSGHVRRH